MEFWFCSLQDFKVTGSQSFSCLLVKICCKFCPFKWWIQTSSQKKVREEAAIWLQRVVCVKWETPEKKCLFLLLVDLFWLFGWWLLLGQVCFLHSHCLASVHASPLTMRKKSLSLSLLSFIVSAPWTARVFFFPTFSVRRSGKSYCS